MDSKKLFILLIFCLFIYLSECRGGRGGGGGRSSSSSRGGSSWGKGWGGSSSGSSWSKPSSSWGSSSGSSWGSSGNSYKPSTSWNTGSSSGSIWGSNSGSHSYPSNTGLSGTGSSKYPSSSGTHSYPSNTGLSGSGTGSHSYPSGTGLSGSGSSKYPSSYGTHSYPSNTGLSGSGTGSHSYPSGTGLSGSGSSKYPSSYGTHSYPSNTGSGSGTRYNYGSSYQPHYIPTYYTAPQHVYVTEYRDSGSRYGDLLTGLTLYNMGRSHSHYHDHYYYDDYYRHRYQPSGSNNYQQSSYDKPNSEATCTLRIKNDGKLDILKIPCEIVSTFTEGKKVESETHTNNTVCTSNITVTKFSPVINTTVTAMNNFTLEARELLEKLKAFNSNNVTSTVRPAFSENTVVTNGSNTVTQFNPDIMDDFTLEARDLLEKLKALNFNNVSTTAKPALDKNSIITNGSITEVAGSDVQNNVSLNVTTTVSPAIAPTPNVTQAFVPIVTTTNKTEGNVFTQSVKIQKETETIVNVTVCTTVQYTDPLSVKGGSITDTSNMECSVDIRTKEAHIRNPVQCKTLMEYSRMPPPKAEPKPLLPSREKLKSWIQKPPWWMAMFIAV